MISLESFWKKHFPADKWLKHWEPIRIHPALKSLRQTIELQHVLIINNVILRWCGYYIVLSWQLSEDFSIVMDIKILMYLVLAAQIAYIITQSRSVQVEQGKVEGFRGTLKDTLRTALVNAKQPFKCKAAHSLAAYATRTNHLVPTSLTLWISSFCISDPSACTIQSFMTELGIYHYSYLYSYYSTLKCKHL